MLPLIPLIQAGVGIAQGVAGLTMKNKRPDYASDDHLKRQEQVARMRLANPYAEEARARERASMAISNNIDSVRSGKAGGRLDEAALFGAATQAQMSISDKVDSAYRTAEDRFQGILSKRQAYEESRWDWENKQRFQERAAAKSALINAGIKNTFGGVKEMGEQSILMDHLKNVRNEGSPLPESMDSIQPKQIPLGRPGSSSAQMMLPGNYKGSLGHPVMGISQSSSYSWP